MQIIFLSTEATLLADICAWVVIHLSIGYWCSQLPVVRFDPDRKWYQTFHWEKGGRIYDQLFKVRSWKKFIPFCAKIYPNTFSMQHLHNLDGEYLTRLLKETCRAEFCHWVMILPGFFFFLWNSVTMGWLMVAYAVLNNLVPIVLQRFNRPRIRQMILRMEKNAPIAVVFPVIERVNV